jgi:hypothetical protein
MGLDCASAVPLDAIKLHQKFDVSTPIATLSNRCARAASVSASHTTLNRRLQMLLDPIVSIRIEPEYKQVRVQFNDDEGQFFYLPDTASAELLRERIARMCLGAWVYEHWDMTKEGPFKEF